LAVTDSYGSISADPVVDLDGRKQPASLSGAEADLPGRRDRPTAVTGDRLLYGSPGTTWSSPTAWLRVDTPN